jgi:hypothetical protein
LSVTNPQKALFKRFFLGRYHQGSHFAPTFKFYTDSVNTVPMDLTGATATMQFRKDDYDGKLLLSLSSPSGGLTIDTGASTIQVVITAAASTAIRADKGDDSIIGRYDLEITIAGQKTRVMQGDFSISREVTLT